MNFTPLPLTKIGTFWLFSWVFGLDFPLGVQTLVLACSVMMMMMESNYAVHVL